MSSQELWYTQIASRRCTTFWQQDEIIFLSLQEWVSTSGFVMTYEHRRVSLPRLKPNRSLATSSISRGSSPTSLPAFQVRTLARSESPSTTPVNDKAIDEDKVHDVLWPVTIMIHLNERKIQLLLTTSSGRLHERFLYISKGNGRDTIIIHPIVSVPSPLPPPKEKERRLAPI